MRMITLPTRPRWLKFIERPNHISIHTNIPTSFQHGSGKRAQSSSLAPKAQTPLAPGEKVFLEGKVRKRAKMTSKELVRIRHVNVGILPCVKITNLNRDANSATNVCSDTEADGSPVKSRSKVVGRISCFSKGVHTIRLRVPRYRGFEEVCCTEKLKIVIKSRRHILHGHVAPHQNSGKKGSIARSYSKA